MAKCARKHGMAIASADSRARIVRSRIFFEAAMKNLYCLRAASVLATLSTLATLLAVAHAAPLAFVPNEKSGTVSVVDTATDTVLRSLAAGKRPRGIAAAPGGSRLFVTDAASSMLLMLDSEGGTAPAPLALGKSPEGVSVSPDGRYVAVAVEEGNSVTLVDAHTGMRLADIPVQGRNPEHAVFSPDSRWLYVSAEEAEQVDVIDVAARRQSGAVAVGLPRMATAPTSPANW
jgi:YVTN family beta-propeller protein